MAHVIQVPIVGTEDMPIVLGWNDRDHVPPGSLREDGIGIIGFVPQQGLGLEAVR
jgi:hypothetical protein